MRSARVAKLSAIVFVTACAPAKQADMSTLTPNAVVGGRRNLIAETEIATLAPGVQTAYGIVKRLRPDMLLSPSGVDPLQPAGNLSRNAVQLDVAVFLDNERLGNVRTLEDIARLRVREIRYLARQDAERSLGVNNVTGVIQVISKN